MLNPTRGPVMTIEELRALKPYLKVSSLVEEIDGLNKHTVLSKLRRGTELTIVESDRLEEKIQEVLREAGFDVWRA